MILVFLAWSLGTRVTYEVEKMGREILRRKFSTTILCSLHLEYLWPQHSGLCDLTQARPMREMELESVSMYINSFKLLGL